MQFIYGSRIRVQHQDTAAICFYAQERMWKFAAGATCGPRDLKSIFV